MKLLGVTDSVVTVEVQGNAIVVTTADADCALRFARGIESMQAALDGLQQLRDEALAAAWRVVEALE